MGSGGGSTQSTDTSSHRDATASTVSSRTLPSFLTNLLTDNSTEAAIGSSLSGNQNSFLSGLLTKDTATSVPGVTGLQTISTQDPHDFEGHSSLVSLANRNPYATDYETLTNNRYDDTVRRGVAASQTGGERVRGGQDHAAIAEGEAISNAATNRFKEVSDVQRQDAEVQNRAVGILQQIEKDRNTLKLGAQNQWAGQYLAGINQGIEGVKSLDQRRGINSANIGLASEMMGTKVADSHELADGHGQQASNGGNWNAGLSCCFIFLEALNGQLPWYVRKARDMFISPTRRQGYVRMSKWLVPAMQRHSFVKWLVNQVLIKPFLGWGAWYFGEKPITSNWRFAKPYIFGWFKVWDVMGRC